jgi:hypothetical protein
MRRAVLLGAAALLLAALGMIVLAEIPSRTGMPSMARTRLDQYLDDTYPLGEIHVVTAVRAKRPAGFEREMSGLVFGDGVYYQSDLGPVRTETDSLLPLPYPPRELWCVLLQDSTAVTEGDSHVVFPALHMDIYNADWLVHVASPESDMSSTLEAVGCALPLD